MAQKTVTRLVDFSHDPAVLRDSPSLPEVFGISEERADELLDTCPQAYLQRKAEGFERFDYVVTFMTLLEADAFTPQELAFYATIGFGAHHNLIRARMKTMEDPMKANPELKPHLEKAMVSAAIRQMLSGFRQP